MNDKNVNVSSEASADVKGSQNETSHTLSKTEPTPPPTSTEPLEERHQEKPELVESKPTGTLVVRVTDEKGWPVTKLGVRVINKSAKPEVTLMDGTTGPDGELPPLEDLPVGTRFAITVKRDSGDYKFAAIGTIQAPSQHCGNLCIPRQRFEFTTYGHQGSPGQHEAKRQEIAKSQGTQALKTPNPALNTPKQATVQPDRDKMGQPISTIKYGLPNMWGIIKAGVASQPRVGDTDKVKALIDFAMEQITWAHPHNQTSETIIRRMQQGQYVPEKRSGDEPGRGYSQSRRSCTKYVKIALWRSGYVESPGDFAPNVSLARDLGPALEKLGFSNVLSQIPDARWAAPGDIIVYQRLGDPEAAGHVDIRSYDGYISDFYDNYLPVTGFKVTGVYRKHYDPIPEARMKALLKVIRSREAETVFLNQGDANTYKALPLSAKMGLTFDDFSTHPFQSEKTGRPSGAYGIQVSTWRRMVDETTNPKPWVPLKEGTPKFSALVQDRIAIALMELHPGVGYARNSGKTALGLLRVGDFEGAANLLASVKPYQWPSLPGGSQSRYSMEQMRIDFQKYLMEYSR